MTHLRVPYDFFERPDVIALGATSVTLHLAALAYAGRNLTDDFIPGAVAARLLPGDTSGLIGRLVGAGWWDRVAGGYRLVALVERQPTAAQVQAQRVGTRRRVREHRERNAVTDDVTSTVTPLSARARQSRGRASGAGPGSNASANGVTPDSTASARLGRIIDAVRDAGVNVYPTARDRAVLGSCAAPADLISAAYVAAADGSWDPGGDGWLAANLSLHAVIDRLAGFDSGAASRSAPSYLDGRYGSLRRATDDTTGAAF